MCCGSRLINNYVKKKMCRKITSSALWMLWIVLQSSPSTFALDRPHVPIIEFPYQKMVVPEDQPFVDIPVVRRNDLPAHASVSCTTESLSAKAGQDFKERAAEDANSTVAFLPWEASASCRVFLLDDAVWEPNESFRVALSHATSSGSAVPALGSNSTVTVTIVNEEDTPTVQLEHDSYAIPEPPSSDRVALATLKILRLGDTSRAVTVRVSTRDGLAVAGTDYNPTNKFLTLGPGVACQTLEVEVLHNPAKSAWSRTFSVDLSRGNGSVPANLGAARTASVTVVGGDDGGSPILPRAPVVVSLRHYDDVGAAVGTSPSPGFPLVCVAPCDSKFPERLAACRGLGTNSTNYLWEIASPLRANRSLPAFKPLLTSTVFARVDTMVLDSIFFREGLLVRCAVWPKHGNVMGIPVRSEAVTVGGDSICRTTAHSEFPVGLQSQSFIATLKYTGFQDADHANRLHIHVEIPHEDGMLPLISTHALYNVNLLLTDPVYSKQHVCSNLNMLNDSAMGSSGFLNTLDRSQDLQTGTELPHQFSGELRGDATLLLYRHLKLEKCMWSFDAWYHMAELVDLCGGYVLTESQVKTLTKSSMTVRVPLYVSYVRTVSLSGWTSVEHHTEMDFSFSYKSLLWQAGVELEHSLEAQLQILRVSLGSNGQLIVHFQTKAMFRGLFVMQHHTLPNEESQLIPPNHLLLAFTLDLLWTAETFDGPTQTWRAISDYSLKDYTGKYTLQLIPCTVSPTQIYTAANIRENAMPCTAHPPQKFVIPIAFQQAKRPVPVTYTLNTEFHLLNNENIFLSDPRHLEYPLLDADYNVAFSKGQKVYGRVLWHPSQDLASAYQLQIEKVFLCAGLDSYRPVYDPSGEEYGEGSQFGCLRPNKKLKHRIVVLDRTNFYEGKTLDGNFLDLNAIFAKDNSAYALVRSVNGMDGFVFDVDGLYKIGAVPQWFVQVLYTIGLAENSKRFQRSVVSGLLPSQNGTNMKSLILDDPEDSERTGTSHTGIASITIFILLALIVTGLFMQHYRRRRHCRQTVRHSKKTKCVVQPLLANKRKDDDVIDKTAANQYCTVRFQNMPAAVCLNLEATDMTEV